MKTDIILIGPFGAGKTTVGLLLAERLGWNMVNLDYIRQNYYDEIGYNADEAQRLEDTGGFLAKYRYWKPFELHAAERVLEDYASTDEPNIIDFGAGHSVQDDPALMERLAAALAPWPNVFLLRPSPDPVESAQILRQRGGPFDSGGVDFYDYFVNHPSNKALAKFTVYTNGKTPEEVADEIQRTVGLRVDTPKISE